MLAFISSVMDDEMQPARDRLVTVLDGAPFLLAWAFEYTPASSQNVDWSYLEKVRRSAFVFWLVGRNTTEPVEAEINEALAADRRLVVLRLPKPTRDERSLRLLERVRPRAKYRDVADLDQLAVEATLAVNDEISRALQDLPGMSRIARLDELGRASRARSIERWQAADVPLAQALELSDDLTVGAPPEDAVPREANPLVILRGDVGAGKSLSSERLLQAAIARQLEDATAPVPVFVRARDVGGDLKATALAASDGLGDPRQQGVFLVIDGADEPGIGAAAESLREARELTGTWPRTSTVITTRPLSPFARAEEAVDLSRMSPEGARALIGRIAGREVTLGQEAGWPANLREAIRLPLFAVLLGGHLRRSGVGVPASRAQLLSDLVQRGLARAGEDAAPLLRKLATVSLRYGGGPVPEAEVGSPGDLERLEESRLVARRGATVVFPLIVIAQWFAAESLVEGEPTIGDLVREPESLELWRYPLALVVGTRSHAAASAILGPLAQEHAGFASQIVEEGIAKWSSEEDVSPPPPRECGARIRAATAAWLEGIRPLDAASGIIGADGRLAAIGVHADDRWLDTGWFVAETSEDDVLELPTGVFGLLQSPEEAANWRGVRGARPGRQPAWAWRWAFEGVRDEVKALIKARAVPLLDSPLRNSRLWTVSCALLNLPFVHDEPIDLRPLAAGLPDEADVLITSEGRHVAARGVAAAMR